MRTCIISLMSFNFGQIRPSTRELAALECHKSLDDLNFGQIPPLTTELVALDRLQNRCHHVISFAIDLILFKRAGDKDMHTIMDEFEF